MNRIAWQEAQQKLEQRYEVLPANDKRALLIMASAIALSVLYLSVSWSRDYQQAAIQRFKTVSEDSRWIALNMPQISNLVNAAAKPTVSGSPDASLINRAATSAKPFGVVFKRFQPEGENGLRLWIEGAEFDQLMRWAAALDNQGISLDQIDIDKQPKLAGVVDARVLLSIKL